MVMSSCTTLSMSIEHYHLIPIALLAVIGSFLVTDLFKLISIEGWVANVISLAILFFSMRDFFPGDSASKLISVANLLVYLQAVLLFQKKTPRLTWQIMVLSLLQVVITTIFSIQFEGGLLFILFFISGGCALVLQNIFANEYEIENLNEASKEHLDSIGEQPAEARLAFWKNNIEPVPSFERDTRSQNFSLRVFSALPGVLAMASVFTLILFLTAPRHVQPWFSPITIKVASSGMNKQVDLRETGEISLSTGRVFKASFTDVGTGKPIELGAPTYFRGIALSRLVMREGKTSWIAPYDRLFNDLYDELPQLPRRTARQGGSRIAVVETTLEQTTDPMLYTVAPVFLHENTSGKIRFCHEISAHTRCRENEKIEVAPFTYELTTILDGRSTTARAWPYRPNSKYNSAVTMADDRAQFDTLTELDPENYPTLVSIAKRIKDETDQAGGGRMELVRRIENHFLDPSNYSYTLDYSDVEWDESLDPIEDFVRNTKVGHCEVYASAMTLMLRSLGIPARYVIGFHGGEYNKLTQSYVVRGNHAHAWVEVYLQPRDCRNGKLDRLQYGRGGAWLTADPTPGQPSEESGLGTDDAIELARTVWQDYVLGMEPDDSGEGETPLTMSLVRLLEQMDMEQIPTSLASLEKSELTKAMLPVVLITIVLFGLLGFLRALIRRANYEEEIPQTAAGKIRRFVADAIGLISSDLREWVIGHDSETAFYRRMVELLENADLERNPNQTHLEFAQLVSAHYADHPKAETIAETVVEVTRAFNAIRFGGRDAEEALRDSLNQRVDHLKLALQS
jgi:transglutaminase-like putative cysteine protease